MNYSLQKIVHCLVVFFLAMTIAGCFRTLRVQHAYHNCKQQMEEASTTLVQTKAPHGKREQEAAQFSEGVLLGMSLSYCEVMKDMCRADAEGVVCEHFIQQF